MSGRPNQPQDPTHKARDSADHNRRLGVTSVLPGQLSFSVSTTVHMQRRTRSTLGAPGTASSNYSTSWSTHDDNILMNARARSHGWSQIQKEHFPLKTPNACRKRYERLVAKKRGPDWDPEKLERLSREYCQLREQTWKPLADAMGEKWQDVEKVVSLNPAPTKGAYSLQKKTIMLIDDLCSALTRASGLYSLPAAPAREILPRKVLLLMRPPAVIRPRTLPVKVGRTG